MEWKFLNCSASIEQNCADIFKKHQLTVRCDKNIEKPKKQIKWQKKYSYPFLYVFPRTVKDSTVNSIFRAYFVLINLCKRPCLWPKRSTFLGNNLSTLHCYDVHIVNCFFYLRIEWLNITTLIPGRGYFQLVNIANKPAYNSHNLSNIILLKCIKSCKMLEYTLPAFQDMT